jgi:siderophore synthetase component
MSPSTGIVPPASEHRTDGGTSPDDRTGTDLAGRADAYASAPLLNCLLREVAVPEKGGTAEEDAGGPRVHRLPSGRLLRVKGSRRPADPWLYADGVWRRVDHTELVKLVAEELRRYTGTGNDELPGEMLDSRVAVAALLAARARATPPDDPYLRSEQALITGHPCHPAPKARGGGPVASWLPYAPEAHARFPLTLLAVREDELAEDGDVSALDALGTAPPGYRLLPAHPWQLALVAGRPHIRAAFADGRLLHLGRTDFAAWPTAAVRTLHVPEYGAGPGRDLFVKFSLDVRITNDIRRLWRHDLLRLRRTDTAVSEACAALGNPAGWLSDRGYRTARFAFEELAVLVRDGLHGHVPPGTTPLLAAALAEGFEGSPLDGSLLDGNPLDGDPLDGNPLDGDPLDRQADPAPWWAAYLRQVVPPLLELYDRHGVVVEAHLQNCLIAVDTRGIPARALFRDAEGAKVRPDVSREAGWERLVYCLLVNHLSEIAGALGERRPGFDPWPAVRAEFARRADLPEVRTLLASPTVPGKTNLLLRWTGADGADARYRPLPNPLTGGGRQRDIAHGSGW